MKYYEMNDAELLNAYNASAEYVPEMCEEICSRVGMDDDYYYAEGSSIVEVMAKAVELFSSRKLSGGYFE